VESAGIALLILHFQENLFFPCGPKQPALEILDMSKLKISNVVSNEKLPIRP